MNELLSIVLNLISSVIFEIGKKFKLSKNITETKKISERLQYVLELMNEHRDEKFTVAELSKILKLKKISELEKYFLNEDEPTFKFLKKFTNEFAINLEWLTEGKGYPFKCDQHVYIHFFEDCLNRIEELHPEIIYFIRADSFEGQTCIMLKINDYKFIVLDTYLHFSKQNGHGGTVTLVDFRKLVMTLILEKRYITKGVIVSKKVFKDLYQGKVFPYSSLKLKKGIFDYWHDDFTDIYNERYGYQRHSNYDQNFIDAFTIVKSYIEKNS